MIGSEAEARTWVEDRGVSRETLERLDQFAALVSDENERQNLVSRGTLPHFWQRHIVDSAQLILHDPDPKAPWLDLGSGAGLPGLVVAMLRPGPVTLVEERRLRSEFLARTAEALGLTNVVIVGIAIQKLEPRRFAAISARAFAPLPKLLALALPFSMPSTRWILPKGRNAAAELEQVAGAWQGDFQLVPSLTDPDAWIIVGQGVKEGK